jgi:hypothetical protein
MDFKSIISKISSLNDEVKTIAAPVLPQSVQLNEDAQLRVLAGTSSYVTEAKKKAEEKKDEEVKEEMKVGDTKKTAKGGTVTKTEKGITHKAGPGTYGGSDDKDTDLDADDEAPKAKKGRKRSNEAIDAEAFKGKFAKMVEAKKDQAADKKKKKVSEGSMKDMMYKDAQRMSREKFVEKYPSEGGYYDDLKKMDESAKPDFLDIDKDGDKKEPMKKAAGEKGGDKPAGKKGMSDKQAKYFGKKNESVSPAVKKKAKKVVAESVETKLSFKQMVQLVQESGGQQQIDPKDKELFNWASRVAASKLGEGMKAELYAGLIYERNGGVFEMYDVLSEAQK